MLAVLRLRHRRARVPATRARARHLPISWWDRSRDADVDRTTRIQAGARSRARRGSDAMCAAWSAAVPELRSRYASADRKSTRLNSVTNAHLVCRRLLE